MAVDIVLHDDVKRRLRARGVTFAHIAAEISVSPSLVTMVSQGRRFSPQVAKAIARHLNQEPSKIWKSYNAQEDKHAPRR